MKARARPGTKFTFAEDSIIREHSGDGIVAIVARMPWRTKDAIRTRAKVIGVKIRHGNSVKASERPLPENMPPLVRQLYEEVRRQKLSLHEVSVRSGVYVNSIDAWKGHNPRVDLLAAALNAVGLDLAIVPLGNREISKEKAPEIPG